MEGFPGDGRVWVSLPRGRRIAYILWALFYAAVFFLVLPGSIPSNLFEWFLAPFLGFMSFHFLRAGLSSKPRFELGPQGLIDRTFMGGGEVQVNWSEIRDIRWSAFGGRLEILVANPAEVRRRAGWPRRLWMFLGGLRGKKTISIIPTSSGPNLVELEPLLHEWLFEYERAQMAMELPKPSPGGATLPPGTDLARGP